VAVAFDAVAAGDAQINDNSLTGLHTVGAGADRLVLLACAVGRTSPGGNSTLWTRSATFGGVSMTELAVIDSGTPAGSGFALVFGLFGPPTGSSTWLVTVNGTVPNDVSNTFIAVPFSYNGVGSVGTPQTGAVNPPTAPSLAVTSATNNRAVWVACTGSSITGNNQTQRYLNNFSGGGAAAGDMVVSDPAGASSVTFSATANSDKWGYIGLNLIAAAAGGVSGSQFFSVLS